MRNRGGAGGPRRAGRRWGRNEGGPPDAQISLFPVSENPLVAELRERRVDDLTPLEALNLIAAWKAKWGAEPDD